MTIYQELVEKKEKLAVIGLGYVGLPVALEFAKSIMVVGFDIDANRLEQLKKSRDPSNELNESDFKNRHIEFTNDIEVLRSVKFYVVAVPTPVDKHNVPDLTFIRQASETVGKVLKKGDYVVYESTVYPGCTEEDCLPVIERTSGLKLGSDFKLGYSPERINPGDKQHSLTNIVKVVSGSDTVALEEITKTYEIVSKAGVYKASSIKVAEAAKIIENTQRNLNIALMNELSIIFDVMGINTYEVLEAAGTKWNFLKFSPGLVGGHCIGVDPYYLTYKSIALGYEPQVILSGRLVNDEMPLYVARKIMQHITKNAKQIKGARVLIMGATFKENVSDVRNSRIINVVNELHAFSLNVDVVDPRADNENMKREHGYSLAPQVGGNYDAVILAVAHDEYKNLTEEFLLSITNPNAIFADLKGLYRNKFSKIKYWSL